MSDDAGRQPWDRRRTETPHAHGLFMIYRDMGRTRSLRKMYAVHGSTVPTVHRLGIHSSKHDWTDRAAAWDEFLDRERAAEAVVGARDMARDHVTVAKLALRKAYEKLQAVDPERLSVREAVLLAQFAVATERAARGEVSHHVVDHQTTPDRLSGAEILKTLRDAPDILDLVRQIDERLAANGDNPV